MVLEIGPSFLKGADESVHNARTSDKGEEEASASDVDALKHDFASLLQDSQKWDKDFELRIDLNTKVYNGSRINHCCRSPGT